MRFLATILLVLAATTACAHSPEPAPKDASEAAIVEYLLDSASTDFRKHGPETAGFRKVRFGYVVSAGGGQMALLCGDFQQAAGEHKGEWVSFATLRTSGYEQWIGDNGAGFCNRPNVAWEAEDLSAELQRRVDAKR